LGSLKRQQQSIVVVVAADSCDARRFAAESCAMRRLELLALQRKSKNDVVVVVDMGTAFFIFKIIKSSFI
jgi:flagellar biosynthesis/type III secretory pathway ATPase